MEATLLMFAAAESKEAWTANAEQALSLLLRTLKHWQPRPAAARAAAEPELASPVPAQPDRRRHNDGSC